MKSSADAARLERAALRRGAAAGMDRAARIAADLADQPMPPGVRAEALPAGVRLTARNLKFRIVRNPQIGRLGR